MSTQASEDVTLSLKEGEEPGDSDNELKRKMSSASFYSTDGGEEDDENAEDDDDDRKDAHVALGPQLALKEQLEMDKNPDPEVKIQSLTIITPDRPDLVLPIPFVPNAKGYAFTLKDSSRYRLKFSFTVSNNIVSGLRYTNTVWKTGVRVENTKVMLGTFSPQKEPYTYELEEDTTPSGIFARGSYSAKTKFVDDDGKCYLEMSYYFEIRKDWS
ncbi:hypothetical protein KFK09_005457 [Dendrobium nobile]|uniref:Rho GDP-dissociation inhibitor 1-like n=1 Tax=Dendrobium nobile TaxID=94219 RepID=A0A8T3BVV4_DENNO|nr:hypothetical protein KFK09_005457 [Dendrobium nobile]